MTFLTKLNKEELRTFDPFYWGNVCLCVCVCVCLCMCVCVCVCVFGQSQRPKLGQPFISLWTLSIPGQVAVSPRLLSDSLCCSVCMCVCVCVCVYPTFRGTSPNVTGNFLDIWYYLNVQYDAGTSCSLCLGTPLELLCVCVCVCVCVCAWKVTGKWLRCESLWVISALFSSLVERDERTK